MCARSNSRQENSIWNQNKLNHQKWGAAGQQWQGSVETRHTIRIQNGAADVASLRRVTLLLLQALGAIDVEEEDKWTLEELGIDFPTEWASNQFLEGRNW